MMKKLVALLMAMVFCCALVLPAAAEGFVPSISYKDHPDVVGKPEIKDEDGKDMAGVEIVVTPVADALNTQVEDRTDAEKVLVDVFDQLNTAEMELPIPSDDPDGEEKNYVIRDLVDIGWIYTGVDPDQPIDPEWPKPSKAEITFDLGVKDDVEVVVMIYDGTWKVIEGVENNGDGTITIVVDKFGPVVFCVEDDGQTPPSPTSDILGQEILTWVVLMVASTCVLILMVTNRRKARY